MLRQINDIDAFKFKWQQQYANKEFPYAGIWDYVQPKFAVITPQTDNAFMENFFTHVFSRMKNFKELNNYTNLLFDIYKNYPQIELSEASIKHMHQRLFAATEMKTVISGQYKTKHNHITVYDKNRRKVTNCFEAASPEETPHLMAELVTWTNANLASCVLHPLITIGIFADYFLAIHPFLEGNGRVVRALVILLLLKARYTYMPYASFESIIKLSMSSYYRALWLTNQTIWSKNPNFAPWLSFFISALEKHKLLLEEKVLEF